MAMIATPTPATTWINIHWLWETLVTPSMNFVCLYNKHINSKLQHSNSHIYVFWVYITFMFVFFFIFSFLRGLKRPSISRSQTKSSRTRRQECGWLSWVHPMKPKNTLTHNFHVSIKIPHPFHCLNLDDKGKKVFTSCPNSRRTSPLWLSDLLRVC